MATMPKMTELVENQLTFQKRVMDEQARFVRSLMKAMSPVMEKVDAPAAAPAAGPKLVKPTRTSKRAKPMTPAFAHEPRRLTHQAS
jgi:hypothetical protein